MRNLLIILILQLGISLIGYGQNDVWQEGNNICMTKDKAAALLNKSDSLKIATRIIDKYEVVVQSCQQIVDNCEKSVSKLEEKSKEQKSIMLEKDSRIEAETLRANQYYSTIIEHRQGKNKLKREKTWIIVGGVAVAILTGVGGYFIGKSIP